MTFSFDAVRDLLLVVLNVSIFSLGSFSLEASSYARIFHAVIQWKSSIIRAKNFDLICCRCGSTEPDALVNEEMKRQYKVVNPVCRACSEKGAKPVVSAPKTVTASAVNFVLELNFHDHQSPPL